MKNNVFFRSVILTGTLLAGLLPGVGPAEPESNQESANHSSLVYPGPDGRLVYKPYAIKGDRILDFSVCGYKRSEEPIPDVPVVMTLSPPEGETTPDGNMAYPKGPDSTLQIQAALDEVALRGADETGFRGAVLLKKGTWYVNGELVVGSGVVLRGEGDGEDGTVLIIRNPKGVGIQLGKGINYDTGDKTSRITDAYVPAGSMSLTVEDASFAKPGDFISIQKSPNNKWIDDLKIKKQGWKARQYNMHHLREVMQVDGNKISIDAPLPQAIAAEHGGGYVSNVDISAASTLCGVESLRVVSNYDASPDKVGLKGGKVTCSKCKPEKAYQKKKDLKVYFPGNNRQVHVEDCMRMDGVKKEDCEAFLFSDLIEGSEDENYNLLHAINVNAMNAWVRDCTGMHMRRSAVLLKNSAYITVRDCKSLKPVSRIRGGRRYSFANSDSSMTLFYNCFAENGRHDFSTGSRDTGPIAFVKGRTRDANAMSEPHMKWATGILFDNITMKDGGGLQVYNSGGSHGWTGANTVFWNCVAPKVRVQDPPTLEQNFAIGCILTGSQKVIGDGYVESTGTPVEPQSLFVQQLIDRIGKEKAMQVLSATKKTSRWSGCNPHLSRRCRGCDINHLLWLRMNT